MSPPRIDMVQRVERCVLCCTVHRLMLVVSRSHHDSHETVCSPPLPETVCSTPLPLAPPAARLSVHSPVTATGVRTSKARSPPPHPSWDHRTGPSRALAATPALASPVSPSWQPAATCTPVPPWSPVPLTSASGADEWSARLQCLSQVSIDFSVVLQAPFFHSYLLYP
jgi:hypothetical protein